MQGPTWCRFAGYRGEGRNKSKGGGSRYGIAFEGGDGRKVLEGTGDGEVVDTEMVAVGDALELDDLTLVGITPLECAGCGGGFGVAGIRTEAWRSVGAGQG